MALNLQGELLLAVIMAPLLQGEFFNAIIVPIVAAVALAPLLQGELLLPVAMALTVLLQ
jgi:hypothetical protein